MKKIYWSTYALRLLSTLCFTSIIIVQQILKIIKQIEYTQIYKSEIEDQFTNEFQKQ